MTPHPSDRRPARPPYARPAFRSQPSFLRRGFTLIELLIVLAIVGMLAGLLLAAVIPAMSSGRNLAVSSEIQSLEKAIQDFKLRYGTDIPSSIRLYENGADWNNTDNITRRSKAILQRIWPDFDFYYGGTSMMPNRYDINGDGDDNDTLNLSGIECLVFFLGGVCATQDGTSPNSPYIRQIDGALNMMGTPQRWTPIGFSANPQRPFARGVGSRVGPFMEFDITRLRNVHAAGQRMPEYVDPLPSQQTPYAYASATGGSQGSSYRFQDLDYGASDDTFTSVYLRSSDANDPYNPKSYQLISPGLDGRFSTLSGLGAGGIWEKGTLLPSNRAGERDNIANFSGGTLE